MIYIILAVVFIAALLFWWASRPRISQAEEAQATRAAHAALARQIEARRERNIAAWSPIIAALPIIDPAKSPLMHAPVYDCVAGRFELPCQHSSYDRFAGQKHLGMPFGLLTRQELDETLAEFALRPTGSIALIRAGEAAYLVYSDEPSLPGALVQRYVRTGKDQYMAYGWRAGVRVEAGLLDPPFLVRDICARPELWAENLARQQAAWAENADYRAERRRCPHNLASAAA